MLFELCRQSFERFKKQEPDWERILKDDQSFLLAEYRPDWGEMPDGLPEFNYRYNLLSELDEYFIAVCLFLAAPTPEKVTGQGSGKTVFFMDMSVYLQS